MSSGDELAHELNLDEIEDDANRTIEETDDTDAVPPDDVMLWTTEHVKLWLTEEGFEEEIAKFDAHSITGKSILLLEKSDLKEMDILMGRRLELYEKIKGLDSKKKAVDNLQEKDNVVENEVLWKKKMTKVDRKSWTERQKATYLSKIAVLNKEASSLWPGNEKIHIKGNSGNLLKMEEFIAQKVPECTISEIGFGREAIKHHLLQWFHEKTRKIEDGYNYEISHTPAKRAKRGTCDEIENGSPNTSSCSDTCSSTESSPSTESEDNDSEPSTDISEMSSKSARAIILAIFGVQTLQYLTVRNHLLPLGKFLKVKCRSQGKYDMIIPLAKALVSGNNHVEIVAEQLNYKNILRKQVKVITNIKELLKK